MEFSMIIGIPMLVCLGFFIALFWVSKRLQLKERLTMRQKQLMVVGLAVMFMMILIALTLYFITE